ncbi:serine hydrolase [Haliea sp. E1-2-M8]|uniref:serine hydrolase n=1 Tax=Haliea sp. E1-2-M8 TaxID=3064706 RepID=UPI00271B1340|nr:serine hydrolase [Haliea sp. E1-2-M8]MDO8863181.1 serine hydrolase [Haliea sp. E1-2-M8]
MGMTSRLKSRAWRAPLAVGLLQMSLYAAAASPPSVEAIDAAVARTLETFAVPGMTVAVVHAGNVHHAAGYGIRDMHSELPVTAETLFQIGSVSKAFTAASLALLVQEGKVGWDTPVIDYLPEFRMHDPWVTREFTVRDLLTHRSGLPLGAGDLLMFPEGNATRDEIIYALRHLQPSSSFRSRYDYDNLLYIVAGEVVARVAGLPFEEFLERRLLQPLNMDSCAATLERAAPKAAHATPHLLLEGELQVTRAGTTAVIAAAGGITCSAADMAKWMQMLLAGGALPDGTVLLEPEHFAELVRPVTLMSPPGYLVEHAGAHLSAYALGWNVSTFDGELVLSHGGGLWGMTTFIALLPERELAVFASNNLMSPAPRAIVNHILAASIAGADTSPEADWIEIVAGLMSQRAADSEDTVATAAAARAADSKPSLPLDRYAGRYRDPWYGEITITLKDDNTLWFDSSRNAPLSGPLEHFQYDTFVARWTNRQLLADAYVSFTLDPQGGIERIRMQAVSPATDFSYDFHDLDLRPVE